MLPEPHRLHQRADFSRTVRRGRRAGKRDLVVHVLVDHPDPGDPGLRVRFGGPRFGLIVSKAVGPAVVRHRVARRLRHICAELTADISAEVDIVIRALPGAAGADSDELRRQLRNGLRRLDLPAAADPGTPL
ncbi:ribonuclease P protein component [Nocardia speluncae]|uniref:Ribonuclease P protein component n=1 Tax=Nocardia speluncae TaxID=419477 RepID=A0A846XM11_9NOCA|nr:ribonuclease P protein component [Nocardia speluncae]NKY36289.1 ribonuclease P protein component [Nocardia speluncae]